MPLNHVYILTNKNKTVLYIGVTSNLPQRLWRHAHPTKQSFTSKYNCFYLVYFEQYTSIIAAIAREKQLKKYKRIKKDILIENFNPDWNFLNYIFPYTPPSS